MAGGTPSHPLPPYPKVGSAKGSPAPLRLYPIFSLPLPEQAGQPDQLPRAPPCLHPEFPGSQPAAKGVQALPGHSQGGKELPCRDAHHVAEGHDSEQGLAAGLHYGRREAGQQVPHQGEDMQGGGRLLSACRSRATSEPMAPRGQAPMTELGLTHRSWGEQSPDFWEEQSNRWLRTLQNTLGVPEVISYPPKLSRVLHPPLFPLSHYSPTAAGLPTLNCRSLAPALHTSSFFDLLHTELGSGGCCGVMLRGCVSKHELTAPQDRAHAILCRFPHLGEEPKWVEATGPRGTASPRNKPQRQHHPLQGHWELTLGLV